MRARRSFIMALVVFAVIGAIRSATQVTAMSKVGTGGNRAAWIAGADWDPGSFRINQRVADYIAMGVPCVWIVDPYERRAWVIDEDRPPAEVTDGILRSRHFEIALSEVLPQQED